MAGINVQVKTGELASTLEMAGDHLSTTLLEEMIAQILSRLSPKSLMRFKCVRKSWCALIISPNFAAKYLSVSNKHNNLFSSSTTILFLHFVLKDINTEERDLVLSLFNLFHDNDDDNLDSNLEDLIIPAVSMGLRKEYTHISGHCDGILCIFDFKDNVILCNPSIKEFKLLPESQLVLSSPHDFFKAYVGFGYDLISKAYKVVGIISYHRDRGEGGCIFIIPPKAEVYTLGTDSWREIETHNMVSNNTIVWPIELEYCPFFFMYCKGMVYWIAFEQKKKWHIDDYSIIKQVILSFDMSDEVFHVITGPAGSGIEEILDFDYKMLTVWNNDTIALRVCRNRRYASSYDIWVIEEYDVDVGSNCGAAANKEYSWTKRLTFEPIDVGDVQRTMAFGRDSHDRFLLVAKNECVVIFYDVSTNKYMHLPINTIFIRQALFYVNSIVSINGGNYIYA